MKITLKISYILFPGQANGYIAKSQNLANIKIAIKSPFMEKNGQIWYHVIQKITKKLLILSFDCPIMSYAVMLKTK